MTMSNKLRNHLNDEDERSPLRLCYCIHERDSMLNESPPSRLSIQSIVQIILAPFFTFYFHVLIRNQEIRTSQVMFILLVLSRSLILKLLMIPLIWCSQNIQDTYEADYSRVYELFGSMTVLFSVTIFIVQVALSFNYQIASKLR